MADKYDIMYEEYKDRLQSIVDKWKSSAKEIITPIYSANDVYECVTIGGWKLPDNKQVEWVFDKTDNLCKISDIKGYNRGLFTGDKSTFIYAGNFIYGLFKSIDEPDWHITNKSELRERSALIYRSGVIARLDI